jgi:hypothetical protein
MGTYVTYHATRDARALRVWKSSRGGSACPDLSKVTAISVLSDERESSRWEIRVVVAVSGANAGSSQF